MKLQVILFALIFGWSSVAMSQTKADPELKSIEQVISDTEKLTKNKTIRNQLKRTRKQVKRVSELWAAGAIPNSFGLLLEIRRALYKFGSSESASFQNNVRSAMKRLWPFLLKSGRFRSDVQKLPGVTYVRIIVPEGVFETSFPEDAKPGDIVSGRIQASPAHTASLYLVTVMGTPVVADGTLRKWSLPEVLEMVLSDQWGNEIVRVRHPVSIVAVVKEEPIDPELQYEKQPREARPNIEIPHLRFEISSRVKAGGHLIVKGPFDGDFSNTRVGIGKYQGHIVAESAGKLVLFIHPQMSGDWTILIGENENWVRCKTRVQPEEVDPYSTLAICVPPPRV